jgi:hypothetical protein
MALEFAKFRAAGCHLLVAGRAAATPGAFTPGSATPGGAGGAEPAKTTGGRFLTLEDIEVPPELADLLTAIPEADFRADISSTELRARSTGAAGAAGAAGGGATGGGGGGGAPPAH